jgi:hypothetical protein
MAPSSRHREVSILCVPPLLNKFSDAGVPIFLGRVQPVQLPAPTVANPESGADGTGQEVIGVALRTVADGGGHVARGNHRGVSLGTYIL